MSVYAELVLRVRDDENENPTRAEITASTIEAANGPEAIREMLWDVLCRTGYSYGQIYEMLAWVIDNMSAGLETDDDPEVAQAQQAMVAAADLAVYANDKRRRAATGTEDDSCD